MEYAGFRAMTVCCVKDATDEEILSHCNKTNPQRTEGGWHTVINSEEDCTKNDVDKGAKPGQCVECPERVHKSVLCL